MQRKATILVADKPLLLGGVPKEITVEEFVQQYNHETGQSFEWLLDFGKYTHERWKQLGLVLCKINDKVGYGVFASKPIDKEKLVGVYAGEKVKVGQRKNKDSDYFINYSDEKKNLDENDWLIDAFKKGNMSRFFNYAPNSQNKFALLSRTFGDESVTVANDTVSIRTHTTRDQSVKVASDIDSQIATANLCMEKNAVSGDAVFTTLRDIKAGEQLCFDYGTDYLTIQVHKKKLMLLHFNHEGRVLLPKINKERSYIYYPSGDNEIECCICNPTELTNRLFTKGSESLKEVLLNTFTNEQLGHLIDWNHFDDMTFLNNIKKCLHDGKNSESPLLTQQVLADMMDRRDARKQIYLLGELFSCIQILVPTCYQYTPPEKPSSIFNREKSGRNIANDHIKLLKEKLCVLIESDLTLMQEVLKDDQVQALIDFDRDTSKKKEDGETATRKYINQLFYNTHQLSMSVH